MTFVMLFLVSKMHANDKRPTKYSLPIYSQSRLYDMTLPEVMMSIGSPMPMQTQSTKHFSSSSLRIVMHNNVAYWIQNNSIYSADIVDGSIEEDSTKIVDIMSMDKVQLDEMVYIVDRLTEGTSNEDGSTGNTKF